VADAIFTAILLVMMKSGASVGAVRSRRFFRWLTAAIILHLMHKGPLRGPLFSPRSLLCSRPRSRRTYSPVSVFCSSLNNRLSGASKRNHLLPRRISVSLLVTRANRPPALTVTASGNLRDSAHLKFEDRSGARTLIHLKSQLALLMEPSEVYRVRSVRRKSPHS